jgi:hypothetical protein
MATKKRSLVVYDDRDEVDGGGRMIALDPSNASGVPIPAFRMVTTTPVMGNFAGEALINTTTKAGLVWDGSKWVPIVPPSIKSYPNDTAIVTDQNAIAGTYAFSATTGNLYVRYNDGAADHWRQIGVVTYPTEAGLLAATAREGVVAFAHDTNNLFYRTATGWNMAMHYIGTPNDGDSLTYDNTQKVWRPKAMLKAVELTKAQYTSLGTKDPNTIYLITN